MLSWDIKLNGQQYVLTGKGLQHGVIPWEPGKPSSIDSATVGSLHGGIGRILDDGLGRYREIINGDPTLPGVFTPEFADTSVGSFTPASIRNTLPTMVYQGGSDVYVVAGRTVQKFTPSAASPSLSSVTISGSWSANEEFSGSGFLWNSDMVFGTVIDGVGTQHGETVGSTGSTITLYGTVPVGFGASARGKAFWVGAGNKLYWSPMQEGIAFRNSANIKGPQFIGSGPKITWMIMIGTALILFTDAGELLGADETALWSVAGMTTNAPADYLFGRGTKYWQDVLLIPSKTGLWSFHGANLITKVMGGNYVQTTSVERLRGEAVAVGAVGPYAYISQRVPGATDRTRVYRLVRYEQGQSTHDFMSENSANEIVTDFLPYYNPTDSRTRLYYLVYNTSTGSLAVKYRNLRLPTDGTVSDTGAATPATVKLLKLNGHDASVNMTKKWLGVRGHWEKGSAGGGAKVSFANVTVDGKAVAIADVTADGAFHKEITESTEGNTLGRELTSCEVSLVAPAHDTVLHLPLIFDFDFTLDMVDSITATVLIASDVRGNTASMWMGSSRDLADELIALEGTIVQMEFRDSVPGSDPWEVLVEDVNIFLTDSVSGPAGAQDRVAQIKLRRL